VFVSSTVATVTVISLSQYMCQQGCSISVELHKNLGASLPQLLPYFPVSRLSLLLVSDLSLQEVLIHKLPHTGWYRTTTFILIIVLCHIYSGLAPGKTVGDGIKAMEEISKKLLDETFSTALSGSSRDYAESGSNTSFAFILALILIFLVLAAQFESFIDPIIIMITVPLAIAGALLSLKLFGQTLNIFSQIGMIMLIGLVTKNGILIVEFANKKQLTGLKKIPAVMDAAVARFRPILMTSLAMSLGALPLALSLGDASTSRIPLGIVVVGGIMFSLILTLFVIPAMYSFLSSKKKKNALEELDEAAAA
jgi:multidrug efflux pump